MTARPQLPQQRGPLSTELHRQLECRRLDGRRPEGRRHSRALVDAGVPGAGRRFFDVHVEVDAFHEVLALDELVAGYLQVHPDSGPEIAFGALALDVVESRFARHLLDSFSAGRSSLRPATRMGVAA